jgi:hypothetical protein
MALGTDEDIAAAGPDAPAVAVVADDPFAIWRELQDTVGRVQAPAPTEARPDPAAETAASALADLDHPRRVLSEAYIGRDRRREGRRATVGRATFSPRRKLLRLDYLVVLALVAIVVGAVLLVAGGSHPTRTRSSGTVRAGAAAEPPRTRPHTPAPAPVAVAAPATAPSVTVPAAPSVAAPGSPDAMGAEALALVRYPWQQLPGYSIVFRSIADAPSPGFYGNTDFTWGQTGGVSTLYVYPGETVDRLAGIIAFEIGHEVDAAYVEPQGGHEQIAALLGVHPASWAPECDCAEQGYLSGWYAAAFSDYWSPGVGDWSTLAPPPTGPLLAAMEPWLDPRIS